MRADKEKDPETAVMLVACWDCTDVCSCPWDSQDQIESCVGCTPYIRGVE